MRGSASLHAEHEDVGCESESAESLPSPAHQLSGRIEFVILRTAHSPPAASHPALPRRSYSRLQAGEGVPEEDFHLSDQMRF